MSVDLDKSGWENLDGHVPSGTRPMFGPDGQPIKEMPKPEPLTLAERAMFAAVEAGAPAAQAVATGVIGAETQTEVAPLARIRELAQRAMDNPSPAAWAVALAEILREAQR